MHDPKLNRYGLLCMHRNSVWHFFFLYIFFSAGNLWRWNNDGGAMEEEIEREKRREMSNFVGFRDRFRR